ncbi:MAG TPA: LLM class flavin-dependent oxidoreductase [Chloroflexota bacterium]|nr:LLM class flavin-dependent oxidoreductase [Chloroflexota bacterium]
MSAPAAPRRLGLALSNEVPVSATVALARQAEQLGLDEVWLPESGHGRGVFTVAAQVAAATSRIKIGVGIVNPFWRHPSVIAMEAATLDEASRGRVLLGVGAALWTLRALGEADDRSERPLTAMVESIRIVRSMLRGERGVDGQVFSVRAEAHLDFPRFRAAIPVYVGAVNGRMLRASGAWADGVQLGAIASPGYVRWSRDQIARGARAAGRDPAEVDLVSNVLVSVDPDRRAARDAVRSVLAYYIHRVEPVVLSTAGADQREVQRVRLTVIQDGLEAGAELVTDGLIDAFAAAGDPDDVTTRLQEYARAGLRGILAWHVIGPQPDKARALELLAREVRARVFA